MKQPMFIGNIPIDEKRISLIETIVARLTRRTHDTKSAMITPYPISNCITGEDVKGDILKYMFCSKGVIKKGLIYLDKKPKSGVEVFVAIENDIGGETRSYIVSSKQMLVEPNMEVFSSNRLTISINPIDPEEKITEVWLSFLWVPNVKDTDIKSFLIDELEEVEEE